MPGYSVPDKFFSCLFASSFCFFPLANHNGWFPRGRQGFRRILLQDFWCQSTGTFAPLRKNFLLDNLAMYLDIDACHPRSQREQSLLTFEGSQFMGAANIVEKLTVSWIFLRAWIQERFFWVWVWLISSSSPLLVSALPKGRSSHQHHRRSA